MTSSLSLKYIQQISGAGLPSIYFYEGVISMSTAAICFQSTRLPTEPGTWRSGMNECEMEIDTQADQEQILHD